MLREEFALMFHTFSRTDPPGKAPPSRGRSVEKKKGEKKEREEEKIDNICTLLHRSAFKMSAKVRQTSSHFHSFLFKMSLIVSKKLSKIHEF